MRLVIQRVNQASVSVDDKTVGKIEKGFMVLVGVTHSDTEKTIDYLVNKMCHLRIFSDENSKMNLSIEDVKGELLIISQFTLYADCKKGNRPSFVNSANPDIANQLYEYFVKKCKEKVENVQTGVFGADMQVSLINDGPVTIVLEHN